MMRKCYSCNIQFDNEKIRFCPYCGSPLAIDKEYEAEQRRKEEERLAAQEKQKRWEAKCNPVISRLQKAGRELQQLTYDKSFPYNIGKVRSYYYGSPKNEEELNKLELEATKYEDLLGAAYDQGDSNRFDRLYNLVKSEMDLLEEYYRKYNSYTANSTWLTNFIYKFLNGGSIDIENDIHYWEVDDYKRDGSDESHVATTVSWSSIPYADRDRCHLKDSCYAMEGYTYIYKRYNIYKQKAYKLYTFNFTSSGVKGKLKYLSNYSTNWGKTILSIYSDLLTLNNWFKEFVAGYSAPSKSFSSDELLKFNLLFPTKKMEYKQDPKKFDRYYYYQISVRK